MLNKTEFFSMLNSCLNGMKNNSIVTLIMKVDVTKGIKVIKNNKNYNICCGCNTDDN